MKTKIRIIKLSDDQLNDVSGGATQIYINKSSYSEKYNKVVCGCFLPPKYKKNMLRGNKTFSRGNLIGFCKNCHMFVYEYNLSLHQGHNIICAGGR